MRARAIDLFRLAIGLTAFAAASPAWAEGTDVGALLRQGVELRRQHRNEEALAVFERAVELSDTPPARAQLALAEQALGRWLDAERDLDAALAAADDPWIARNAVALKNARAVVEEHVHVATTLVPVAAPEVLTPPPPSALPPSAPPPSAPVLAARDGVAVTEPSSKLLGPLAFGVAGLVGLGAGAYFGVRTFDYKADRDAQCVGGCKPAALTYDAEARSAATTSTIAFGAGAACLAAGVAWWLLERTGPQGPRARGIDVSPMVGTTNGIVVTGAL